MRILHVKSVARLDLLQIWLYLAQDSIPAAIRIGDELEEAIQTLCEMPGKGT